MAYISEKLFLFIFINSIFFIQNQITTNPVEITEEAYIGDYVITIESNSVKTLVEETDLEIVEFENNIKYKDKFYYLNTSFFLCKDESDFYFLFEENNFNDKMPNEHGNSEISSLNNPKAFISGIHYNGFIKDKEYSGHGTEKGAICSILKNAIIIYGKCGTYICFNYIKENNAYFLELGNINNIISFKFIKGGIYICSYFLGDEIKVDIIVHNYVETGQKGLSIIKSITLDDYLGFDNLVLYDTKEDIYKILYVSKKSK